MTPIILKLPGNLSQSVHAQLIKIKLNYLKITWQFITVIACTADQNYLKLAWQFITVIELTCLKVAW